MDITEEIRITKQQVEDILTKIDGRKRISTQTPNEATIAEYKKIFNRIVSKDNPNSIFDHFAAKTESGRPLSIRTFHKEKAALLFTFAKKLREIHQNINASNMKKTRTLCLLTQLILDIKPPTTDQRKPIASKRKVITKLKKLDPNWRETIIGRMPNYRNAMLVLALTGCRPAELVKGVLVTLTGNQRIRFEIEGAKVTQYSGQEKRVLEIQTNSTIARMLTEQVKESGGSIEVRIDKAANLTNSIKNAAKRAYPGLRESVTAYCFRHQCAADWKSQSSGDSDRQTEISMALGHQADHTKQYYGYQQQGSGSVEFPSKVEATTVVRRKNKLDSVLRNGKRPSLR